MQFILSSETGIADGQRADATSDWGSVASIGVIDRYEDESRTV